MSKRFPKFEYVNNLSKHSCNLGEDTFAIIVRGVSEDTYQDFMNFVEASILTPLINERKELPNIIILLEKFE